MEIERVTADFYQEKLTDKETDIFLTPAFNELNRKKVDDIRYLLFRKDNRFPGGIITGVRDNMLLSPFSAPYGGAIFKEGTLESTIYEAAVAFQKYCVDEILECRITFPAPVLYDSTTASNIMFMNGLMSQGFKLDYGDLNFHIDLINGIKVNRDEKRIERRCREFGLRFIELESTYQMLSEVYKVVESNHRQLSYPIRMGLSDFESVSRIADVRLFAVTDCNQITAGAICYLTRNGILQPTFWGDDISKREQYSAMPFLAEGIKEWSYKNDIRIIDLGPSSERGIPSLGLCDFKLRLGCHVSIKPTVRFMCC